jgi:hypothetical protein
MKRGDFSVWEILDRPPLLRPARPPLTSPRRSSNPASGRVGRPAAGGAANRPRGLPRFGDQRQPRRQGEGALHPAVQFPQRRRRVSAGSLPCPSRAGPPRTYTPASRVERPDPAAVPLRAPRTRSVGERDAQVQLAVPAAPRFDRTQKAGSSSLTDRPTRRPSRSASRPRRLPSRHPGKAEVWHLLQDVGPGSMQLGAPVP